MIILIVIIYQPVELALRPTWIRRNATTKRRNIMPGEEENFQRVDRESRTKTVRAKIRL